MSNLTYKGWGSTRVRIGIGLSLVSFGLLMFGKMTSEQWVNFQIWIYGTYALSEVGAKGAEAYSGGGGNG